MRLASIKSLQRDHGLSFTAAEAIIREQTGKARQRYRFWYVLNGIAIVVALVCKFTPRDSLYYHLDDFIFPLACLFLAIGEILVQRAAQPLIRAAAQATAPVS